MASPTSFRRLLELMGIRPAKKVVGREWDMLSPERKAELLDVSAGPKLMRQLQDDVDAEVMMRRPRIALDNEIEAARQIRAQQVAEHRQPRDFSMDPEAISATEDRFEGSPFIKRPPPLEGLSDPSRAIDEALEADIDVYGFAAGGGRDWSLRPPPRTRARVRAELDDVHEQMWSGRMRLSSSEMLKLMARRDELTNELDALPRARPNDAFDPDDDTGMFGFASGGKGGRYDDLGSNEQRDRSLGQTRGTKAYADRRMGQIGDELLNLENQKANLPPEQYEKLRKLLVDEYRQLDKQRKGASRTAADRGFTDPDDVSGYPLSEEPPNQITPGAPGSANAYDDLKRELEIAEERIRRMEERQRRIREIPETTPEQIREQMRKQADLEGEYARSFQGKFEGMLGNMTGEPDLGYGLGPLGQRLNQAARFVPLERQPGEGEQPKPMPRLLQDAMGLGGKALELLDFADPVSQSINTAMFLGPAATGQKTLTETIVAPGTMGSLPRHRAEQAELMRQRRSTRERIEEARRRNAEVRP